MEKLKYFQDESVPITVTRTVNEKTSDLVKTVALQTAFKMGRDLGELGAILHVRTRNILKDDSKILEVEVYCPVCKRGAITRLHVQEEQKTCDFWIIETWNGATVNVTKDEHYITMLLQSER